MNTTNSSRGSDGGRARKSRWTYRVALSGPLDRHETEALQVEIKALAKRHGVTIGNISAAGASSSSR